MLSQAQQARAQGRACVSRELHALSCQGQVLDGHVLDAYEEGCRRDHGERMEILHGLGRQMDPNLNYYLEGQLERLKLVRLSLERGRDPGLVPGLGNNDSHVL